MYLYSKHSAEKKKDPVDGNRSKIGLLFSSLKGRGGQLVVSEQIKIRIIRVLTSLFLFHCVLNTCCFKVPG